MNEQRSNLSYLYIEQMAHRRTASEEAVSLWSTQTEGPPFAYIAEHLVCICGPDQACEQKHRSLELKGQARIKLLKQFQGAHEPAISVLISPRATSGCVKVPFRRKQAEQACRNLWVEDSGFKKDACDRLFLSFVDVKKKIIRDKNEQVKLVSSSALPCYWCVCYSLEIAFQKLQQREKLWAMTKKRSVKSWISVITELILNWHIN